MQRDLRADPEATDYWGWLPDDLKDLVQEFAVVKFRKEMKKRVQQAFDRGYRCCEGDMGIDLHPGFITGNDLGAAYGSAAYEFAWAAERGEM